MNADSIAVIRTRLPYVDRRALSEAWFSALHLAGDEHSPQSRSRKRADGVQPERRARQTVRDAAAAFGDPRGDRIARANPRGNRVLASPASTLPRRIGGAVVAPFPSRSVGYAPVRASFSIGIGRGRVQIVLRRDGRVLHVLAVCSRRDVELVRRALACADLHLRLRGETIRSSVRALGERDR